MKKLELNALIILAKAIMKKSGINYSHYKNKEQLIWMGVDYLSDYQMSMLFNNSKNSKIKLDKNYHYDWSKEFEKEDMTM